MWYQFDEFELRVAERELCREGLLVAIEPKVFDLLCYLVAHRDRAVGRDELIAAVWGRVDLADNTLAQAVMRARRVLEDTGSAPRFLRTLPRHGYRWTAATRELSAVLTSDLSVAPESVAEASTEAVTPLAKNPHDESLRKHSVPAGTPLPRQRYLPRLLVIAAMTLFVLAWFGWHYYGAIGMAQQDVRLAIWPLRAADAEDSARELGLVELLRRELVAQPDAPMIYSSDATARLLSLRDKDASTLSLDQVRNQLGATHVLEILVAKQDGHILVKARLASAQSTRALDEVRDATLQGALAKIAIETLDTLGRRITPHAEAATPADPLSAALQARAQGRVRDAYEQLRSVQQAHPDDSELLVDLAGTECALEMLSECELHLTTALGLPSISPWARASAHLELARRRLAELDIGAAQAQTDAAEKAAAASSDDLLRAHVVHMRQRVAAASGERGEAQILAQRAMTLYRSVGDLTDQADIQHSLGMLANRNGNAEEAISAFDQALVLYRSQSDQAGEAVALSSRADALGHLGRFEEASIDASAALSAADAQQNPAVIRNALDSEAWALLQVGRLADARETVHRALALGVAAKNPRQVMELFSLLGFIEAAGGRFPPTIAAWDKALAVAAAQGAEGATIGIHLALVYACLNAGTSARARTETQRLHEIASHDARPETAQYAEHADALIAAYGNDLDRAATLFASVWAAARRTGTLNQQMLADYAEILFKRNDLAGVETLLGETTLPTREGHLYLLVQARYLIRRGDLKGAQGASDQARARIGERFAPQLDEARTELLAASAAPRSN